MNSEVSLVAVARIIKPFGLRGEVKLHLLADLKDFLSYKEFLIKEKFFLKRLVPQNIRGQGKIVKFEGYASRDDAEALRGKFLYIKENELLEKDHIDEFYSFELEGLEVMDEVEGIIGKVRELFNLNGRWYLDVEGKKSLLIPFIRPIVNSVDWQKKIIYVHLPDGYVNL